MVGIAIKNGVVSLFLINRITYITLKLTSKNTDYLGCYP